MDLGSLYVSVSVIMVCLLGAARTSPNDNNKCCPKIAGHDLTKDPPEDCFKVDGRFRYTCKEGFVRKAGTSDLIRCSESNGSLRWTSATLQCIPDPKRTKPQPPQSTVTSYNHIPPDVTTTGISSTTNEPKTTTQLLKSTLTTGYSHIPPDVTTTSISSTITDPKRTKPQPPQSTVTTGYSHIPPDVTTTGISSTITASTSLQMTHSASISDSAITQTNSAEPTSSSQQFQDAPDPSQVPEEVTKVLTTAKTGHTASASTTSNSSNAWHHGTSDYGQQDKQSTCQVDQMVVAITCVSLAIICASVGFYCYRRRRNMREEAAERPEERVPMNGLP